MVDRPSGGGGFGGLRPNGKGAGIGLSAVLAVIALIWLGSGFYIVPEGQVGVVTTFGKYSETTRPGFRWRLPWPVQNSELVDILSLRRVEVGTRGRPERLKEALMLSDDENIVDIQFEVQYRIKDDGATDYLFNSRNPTGAVIQAAESAMREVVGRKTMDSVLYESRQQIADRGARADAADARPLRHRHPGVGRRHPERAAARAGAGGVRRRGEGRARTASARSTKARPTPTTSCRRRAASRRA